MCSQCVTLTLPSFTPRLPQFVDRLSHQKLKINPQFLLSPQLLQIPNHRLTLLHRNSKAHKKSYFVSINSSNTDHTMNGTSSVRKCAVKKWPHANSRKSLGISEWRRWRSDGCRKSTSYAECWYTFTVALSRSAHYRLKNRITKAVDLCRRLIGIRFSAPCQLRSFIRSLRRNSMADEKRAVLFPFTFHWNSKWNNPSDAIIPENIGRLVSAMDWLEKSDEKQLV